MITALLFLLILVVLVIVHEFGHFIAAKKNGIYVEEFGFGFPPRLFGIRIGETLYSINLLPIGGFVRLFGEEASQFEKEKKTHSSQQIPASRAFVNKKPWQKAIVILAGVIMNFLLGWICISYLFTVGIPAPNGISVASVQKNTPAEMAGIKAKDQLVSMTYDNKEKKLIIADDLISQTKIYQDKEITVKIKRGDQYLNTTITPRSNPPKGEGSLGITITQIVKERSYPWYTAPWYGLTEVSNMTVRIFTELLRIPMQLITQRQTSVEFAGPIGIARVVGEARKYGINALLEITALLSLNLAVINILPFPALDGGRLVFVLYEWISRKKANATLEQYLNAAGIIILIGFSILVTIYDVVKFW